MSQVRMKSLKADPRASVNPGLASESTFSAGQPLNFLHMPSSSEFRKVKHFGTLVRL